MFKCTACNYLYSHFRKSNYKRHFERKHPELIFDDFESNSQL